MVTTITKKSVKKNRDTFIGKQLDLFKDIDFSIFGKKQFFTFVDLFAGIGGFRIPLQELGGKCLGYSEIDERAIKVYEDNFRSYFSSNEERLGDITKIGKLPFEVDIIVGGVPCQSWSVAGNLQGFNDSRGKLWFDTIRVIKINKPKAFILENVRSLMSDAHKESLEIILSKLKSIGYYVKADVLNSYDFGLPQNRERTFIVGIRNDQKIHDEFKFPEPLKNTKRLIDIIDNIEKKELIKNPRISPYTLLGKKASYSRNQFEKSNEFNDFFVFCDTRAGHTTIHSWDITRTTKRQKEICETILKNRRKSKYGEKDGNPLSYENLKELIVDLKETELQQLINKKILRIVPNKGYEFVNSKNSAGIKGVYRIFLPSCTTIPTLTASGTNDFIAKISLEFCSDPKEYKKLFIKEIYKKKKYRPISAEDARKLQGFPEWFKMHENENTAKFQFGNAVSIPVIYHLAKSLLEFINIL